MSPVLTAREGPADIQPVPTCKMHAGTQPGESHVGRREHLRSAQAICRWWSDFALEIVLWLPCEL